MRVMSRKRNVFSATQTTPGSNPVVSGGPVAQLNAPSPLTTAGQSEISFDIVFESLAGVDISASTIGADDIQIVRINHNNPTQESTYPVAIQSSPATDGPSLQSTFVFTRPNGGSFTPSDNIFGYWVYSVADGVADALGGLTTRQALGELIVNLPGNGGPPCDPPVAVAIAADLNSQNLNLIDVTVTWVEGIYPATDGYDISLSFDGGATFPAANNRTVAAGVTSYTYVQVNGMGGPGVTRSRFVADVVERCL